jgi:hypothetical protein
MDSCLLHDAEAMSDNKNLSYLEASRVIIEMTGLLLDYQILDSAL